MAVLVVDACALVHLKQAHAPALDGLLLVDVLCGQGVSLRSTAAVHGENVAQTLRDWLASHEVAGRYDRLGVSVQERREVRNALRRGDKEPGDHDKALIALARRLGAPLFTHDGPASNLANRCEVVVVDAIDLAAFSVRRGWMADGEAERLVAPLGAAAWRPPSWQGSVAATVAARDKWERLAGRLSACWRSPADGPV